MQNYPGCLFGKGLRAPGGAGKGINVFYLSLLSSFGPGLWRSCPAVTTVAVPRGMGTIWGKAPAVAEDKLQ